MSFKSSVTQNSKVKAETEQHPVCSYYTLYCIFLLLFSTVEEVNVQTMYSTACIYQKHCNVASAFKFTIIIKFNSPILRYCSWFFNLVIMPHFTSPLEEIYESSSNTFVAHLVALSFLAKSFHAQEGRSEHLKVRNRQTDLNKKIERWAGVGWGVECVL